LSSERIQREQASAFLVAYYGTENISAITDPLPTVTTKDRFALVMPVVNGQALDIRLRMLKPKELAKAMSFPDDYEFAGTQGAQVKQIGNAWACRLGEALIHELLIGYASTSTQHKNARLRAIA
jgi:DNA (cytosine-5)-methyltransferase 1